MAGQQQCISSLSLNLKKLAAMIFTHYPHEIELGTIWNGSTHVHTHKSYKGNLPGNVSIVERRKRKEGSKHFGEN